MRGIIEKTKGSAAMKFSLPTRTKTISRYYDEPPFRALDDVFGNPTRTSFLRINTDYIKPDCAKFLNNPNGTQIRDYSKYSPQLNGWARYAFLKDQISPQKALAIQLAYEDGPSMKQASPVFNLRCIVGVDYPQLMYYAMSPNTDHLLTQILERDRYLLACLSARVVIERVAADEATKNNASIKLDNYFKEVAASPLTKTPDFAPLLTDEQKLRKLFKDNNYNAQQIKQVIYSLIDQFPPVRPEYATLFKRDYDKMMPTFTNELKIDKEKGYEPQIFADYTPSAAHGDLMPAEPDDRARYGTLQQNVRKYDLVALKSFYGLNNKIAGIYYAPRAVLENPTGHTAYSTEILPEGDAAFLGYSQRAMSYKLLDSLEYLASKGKVDAETVDICKVLLFSNLLGNKVNLLVDCGKLHHLLTHNQPQTLENSLYAFMQLEKANLNWIYADHCANLNKVLPEAREMLRECLSPLPPKCDLGKYRDELGQQYNYVVSRIYHGDIMDNGKILDGGGYKDMKNDLQDELAPINKYDFEPRKHERLF